MEVRCASCNKLFRVSDDKITGSGIKFACTGCKNAVKITREEFEKYSLSRASLQNAVSSAAAAAAAPGIPNKQTVASSAAATLGRPAPAAARPASLTEPGNGGAAMAASAVQNRPAPGLKAEPKAPLQPKPAPAVSPVRPPVSPSSSAPAPAIPPREEALAAEVIVNDFSAAASGPSLFNNKVVILIVAALVIGAMAFGIKSYFGKASQQAAETVRTITSPDGLQVQNAAGTIDQNNQDLIITGVVENTTDKPRPGWYIVVDVYDAQNAVLTKGRLLNGKQLYARRDFEVLARRGANIQDLTMKSLEQGTTIPAKGSVNFEIRLMEPPVGIASFNVTLQPFDPVQLFKEIAEEQKSSILPSQ